MADAFEINDFTTVSEWERVLVDIDDIITSWQLTGITDTKKRHSANKHSLSNRKWITQQLPLKLPKGTCLLSYHSTLPISEEPQSSDVLSKHPDDAETNSCLYLPAAAHCIMNVHGFPVSTPLLTRLFGFDDFVLINLEQSAVASASNSETLVNSILSCLSSVQVAAGCEVPFIIEQESDNPMFIGLCQNNDILIQLETCNWLPARLRCLTGLVEIFKEKIGPCAESLAVKASIRLAFQLEEALHSHWAKQPPDFDSLQDGNFDTPCWRSLPCGTDEDTVKEIYLYTSWLNVNENMFLENENYSDLDPLTAPHWAIHVTFYENAKFLLAERLRYIMELLFSKRVCCDRFDSSDMAENTMSSLVDLTSAVKFLFPDASINDGSDANISANDSASSEMFENDVDLKRLIKSAPIGSLSWRLAIVLLHYASSMQGPMATTYIWWLFVNKLRNHFESAEPISGIDSAYPDFGQCLLHQKLQMLNCCIKHKILHKLPEENDSTENFKDMDNDDETDIEFYDCKEDASDLLASKAPEGRRVPFNDLCLLKRPSEMLYVPLTQDPSPLTEDMLEEQTNMLTQLGQSVEASSLRARIQSASLRSDISSFKAANPGCCFEDFIRWYSPKDWISDSSGGGCLSDRMQFPRTENVWLEAWDSALPCPASKQKLLFDYNKEAEKILHWLSSVTLGSVIALLLPVVFYASLHQIYKDVDRLGSEFRTNVSSLLTDLQQQLSLASQQMYDRVAFSTYSAAFESIKKLETAIANFKSLRSRFDDSSPSLASDRVNNFVLTAMYSQEVAVLGGANSSLGNALNKLFFENSNQEVEAARPKPIHREYILRASCSRPSKFSRVSPQLLYTMLNDKEKRFLLAGAFSEDKIFF